jgi:hypothetical protein
MITITGTTTNATDVATKAYVDSIAGSPGTNLNTPNTTVKRDNTGSFAAQVVSVVDTVASGNLVLSTNPSTSTAGNIMKGSNRFIHNFGTSNTFVGESSGNFTMTGTGQNSIFGAAAFTAATSANNNTGIGYNTFASLSSGNNNIAIGSGAAASLTTGSGNIYLNANTGGGGENNTIRIGTSQTSCFIQGINGINQGGPNILAVFSNSAGQLGTQSSSIRYKEDVQDMNEQSSAVLQLRPVTFVYKTDETQSTQYGLIAEEVDEIFPNIVVRNKNNEIDAVQYHVLPILLLNEMKKQQVTIENLTSTIDTMNAAIGSLKEQLQEFIERVRMLEVNA